MRFYQPNPYVYEPTQTSAPMDNNLLMAAIKKTEGENDKMDALQAELAGKTTIKGGYSTEEDAKAYQQQIDKLMNEVRVDAAAGDHRNVAKKINTVKSMINSPKVLGFMEDYKASEALNAELAKNRLNFDATSFDPNVRDNKSKQWNQVKGEDFKSNRYLYDTKNYTEDFKDIITSVKSDMEQWYNSVKAPNADGTYTVSTGEGKTENVKNEDVFMDKLTNAVKYFGGDNLEGFISRPTMRYELQNNPDYIEAQEEMQNPDGYSLDSNGLNPVQRVLRDYLAKGSSYLYEDKRIYKSSEGESKIGGSSTGSKADKKLANPFTDNEISVMSSAIEDNREVGEKENDLTNNSEKFRVAIDTRAEYINNPNKIVKEWKNPNIASIDNTLYKNSFANANLKDINESTPGIDKLFKNSTGNYLTGKDAVYALQDMQAAYNVNKATVDSYNKFSEKIKNEAINDGQFTESNFKKDPVTGEWDYSPIDPKIKDKIKENAEVIGLQEAYDTASSDFADFLVFKLKYPGLKPGDKEFKKLIEDGKNVNPNSTKSEEIWKAKLYQSYTTTKQEAFFSQAEKLDPKYKQFIEFKNKRLEDEYGKLSTSTPIIAIEAYGTDVEGRAFIETLQKTAGGLITQLVMTPGTLSDTGLNVTDPDNFGSGEKDKIGALRNGAKVQVLGTTTNPNTHTPMIVVKVEEGKPKEGENPKGGTFYIPMEGFAGHEKFTPIIQQAYTQQEIEKITNDVPRGKETGYSINVVNSPAGDVGNLSMGVTRYSNGSYGVKFVDNLYSLNSATGEWIKVEGENGKPLEQEFKNVQEMSVGIYNLSKSAVLKTFTTDEIKELEQKQQEDRTKSSSEATGDLSSRNNNPGNVRDSKGNFKVYPSIEAGFNAMQADLTIKQTGRSGNLIPEGPNEGQKLTPDSPLTDLIRMWAPSSDKNNPEDYAKFVAEYLDIDVDTPIKQIPTDKLAEAMTKKESATSYNRLFGPGSKSSANDVSLTTIPSINLDSGVSQPIVNKQVYSHVKNLVTDFPNITITGAKRSKEKNASVRGMTTSKHLEGKAIDIRSDTEGKKMYNYYNSLTKRELNQLGISQIIDETNRPGYPPHYHIEFI